MDKVKNLMAHGASLGDAVRIALDGKTLGDLAAERGLNRTTLSSALNGSKPPTVAEVEAMAAELGGTFEEWREAFADAAMRRVRNVAAPAAQ